MTCTAYRTSEVAFRSGSDQPSFRRAGYPALMVTDTAFYRYPHYHQPTDTPDRVRVPEMARVVDGLAKAIALVAGAQGEKRP